MCPSPGERWVLPVNAHIATFPAGLTGQMSNHLHLSGKNTLSSSTRPFVTCVLNLMVSFMKGGWRVLPSMEFGQRTDLVLKVSSPLPRWQNLYFPLFKPQCPAPLHPHHTPPCRGSAPSTCPCPTCCHHSWASSRDHVVALGPPPRAGCSALSSEPQALF